MNDLQQDWVKAGATWAKMAAVVVSGIIVVLVTVMAFYAASEPDDDQLLEMHAWGEEHCGLALDPEPVHDSNRRSRVLVFKAEDASSYVYTFRATHQGEWMPMAMCDGDQYLGTYWNGRTGELETLDG